MRIHRVRTTLRDHAIRYIKGIATFCAKRVSSDYRGEWGTATLLVGSDEPPASEIPSA
jgi:hypothetical protein